MSRKAFVLLSGGLDSTTLLYRARQEFPTVAAISVDYGQRHVKEAEYARKTCSLLNIGHRTLKLPSFLSGNNVMLTDKEVEIPNMSYDDIKGVSPTYVPFRNGTLLSLITAHAQKWVNEQIASMVDSLTNNTARFRDPQEATDWATKEMKDSAGVYFGAHAEDAFNWAYPDCTPEFIGAMANAIYIGSYFCIRLHTPLMWLKKSEIVEMGTKLGVPYENTWSCYAGGELHCGTCMTCRARKASFQQAGVKDPTVYAA